MSDYQWMTIEQVWIPLLYLSLVSAMYWRFSKSIFKSAHGALVIVGFAYAVVISEYTEFDPPNHMYWPLLAFVALGFISLLMSFATSGMPKWFHFSHLGTLLCGFLCLFAGLMAIAHDWI